MAHTFKNWSRTLEFKPDRFVRPKTEREIVQLVQGALAEGRTIRTQGARESHSWSQLVLTTDTLVSLEDLAPIFREGPNRQVTVHAGMRIKDLTSKLRDRDLGVANLGSIQEQTIAGATATGTHGTGLGIGNLATQITAIRMVTGTGEIVTFTERDGDYFRAARVSLGALGIVTEVTVQCVEDYDLECTTYLAAFDDVVQNIDAFNAQNTRLRLWWLVPSPFSRHDVLISTMNPPGTGGIPDTTDRFVQAFARPLPLDSPRLRRNLSPARANSATGRIRLARQKDHYSRILTIPLLLIPRHRECEYALPLEKVPEALNRFRTILQEGDFSLTLPLEVRFVASDDNLLSPSWHERGAQAPGVCYIGAYTKGHNTDPGATEVFERFEPLMKELGGRPHWGKHFRLTQTEARAMYPRFDRFNEIRRELDHMGVLENSLIRELFD